MGAWEKTWWHNKKGQFSFAIYSIRDSISTFLVHEKRQISHPWSSDKSGRKRTTTKLACYINFSNTDKTNAQVYWGQTNPSCLK